MVNPTENESEERRYHRQKEDICNILFEMFLVLRFCFDLLIDKIFGFCYKLDKITKIVTKVSNPIVLESATTLARKIQKRELTSEEIVQAFIDRIKEVNTITNSIVDERFEEALKEAKQIDLDIASGTILEVDFREKPFLGIPFTTKESVACKDLAFTFGLKKRKGRKATFDADCVELLKKAGGILLGVSNIPQLNLWQETHNPVYGITNNPYDSSRNVGGSSGGESSIIAACGSPLGIGTDIGGSLRIPSFMCGIFGHKTTCNVVPIKGLTFRTGLEKDTMVVAGPMVKYAEDLIPFLKVLAGTNVEKLHLDKPVPVQKLKVYYVTNPKDPFISPFRDEMKLIFKRTVNHFKEICDIKPEGLHFEDLKYTTKLWKYWMSQEGSNFKNDINDRQGEVNVIWEALKHFTFGGDYTTATIFNLINSLMKKVDEKWAIETTNTLKEALLTKLDENSVLIYPSAPFPASYHHTALLRPYNFNLFAIWNVLKFPVTQVPMGLGKEGLPLGIQVVAAPYQDRLCIAVAKELERQFGGYVVPVPV
ncbi:fatty-acid amide hydrolase 2-A [Sitophilus oryzae]|uniref:Fatty-acid amide hydrolase 2-A n=1 Tax=Sitophilus oryzae TaxID=7048 RepID=A0A6J2YY34_SITOR|nr:fatty-acid amide hydrolase 2-A [Sitophilus oryzae]